MLMIARDYILFRKAVAIAVAGGEYDELRADGLHECFRRRRRAAVMRGDEDLRPEPSAVAGDEPLLRVALDVPCKEERVTAVPHVQHAGPVVAAAPGQGRRVQDAELHAIPFPLHPVTARA